MNIEIKKIQNSTIMKLFGKFDIEESEDFEIKFQETLKENPNNIIILCSYLDFIDSSGIGSMIKCLKLAKNSKCTMYLAELKPSILNVFKLAKLDVFFNIMEPGEFARKYGSSDSQVDDLIDSL